MTKITEHIQKLNLGALVELFQVDLSIYNLGTIYLVNGDTASTAHEVVWRGQTYTPHPIKAEGFELTAQGSAPKPSFVIANVGGLFTPMILAHRDLLGGIITRIRTFEKFLDNGVDPDPLATLPTDVYVINRKVRHTRKEVQWELTAAMDQAGTLLPARQIVRDYCDQTYRFWDSEAGAFDYTNATCPYAGASSFDEVDQSVTSSEDRCGKRLGSCRARFGTNAILPFRGFPAVARIRAK